MRTFGSAVRYSAPYFRKYVFLSPPKYRKIDLLLQSVSTSWIGRVETENGKFLNYWIMTKKDPLPEYKTTTNHELFKRYYSRYFNRRINHEQLQIR